MPEITRNNANALIPVEYSQQIFNGIAEQSVALRLMTRLHDMAHSQLRIPVLETLPFAYWQEADTSAKKTSKQAWKGKYVTAEEIAVIIPISENVLDDSSFPIWDMVMPKVIEAFHQKIDEAVFFGTGANKPASFPDGVVIDALAHGNALSQASGESFYSVVDKAMYKVEDDGFEVNGIVGGANLRHLFRGLLDANGQPLLAYTDVAALPRYIMRNGAWDKDIADFVVGDFKQAVYAIRKDISFKVLTEASITDPNTNETYNLAQQDMVALRVVMRIGWQLPNPITRVNGVEETRYPFAVLVKGSSAKLTVTLPESATFATSLDVEMSTNVADAVIYYTDDGTTPTSASTKYTGKITLSATKTIKAIAIKDGLTSSDVASATYTKA